MKISVLLKREPFDKIFETTLSSFLKDYFKKSYTVSWSNKKSDSNKLKYSQKWLCNPLLNSIFVKGVSQSVFDSINGEYKINPMKPWRSIFQRIYLLLSQNRITAPIFSNYEIYISPPLDDSNNKLIIGGNTKLRIIDVSESKVYVILKEGFDKRYIDREIYVRENFKYLDIPKIHNIGNNSIWYSEDYVTGLSPNRLDSDLGNKSLNKVINGIHKMLIENKVSQPLSKYLYLLKNRVLSGLKSTNYLNQQDRLYVTEVFKKILNELDKYSNNIITTSYCHGDFHQGNILCDGNKNWILDWENSGYKQIGYDLLILLLQSRIADGFYYRFSKLLKNKFDSIEIDIINKWPDINWKNKESKKIYLLLFLLEEFDFYITENSNPLFFKKSKKDIKRYIEIEKCFNSIILL